MDVDVRDAGASSSTATSSSSHAVVGSGVGLFHQSPFQRAPASNVPLKRHGGVNVQSSAAAEIVQRRGGAPTVTELTKDELMLLALEKWLGPDPPPFDPALVQDIFRNKTRNLSFQRIMVLEFSQFLEKYLWPHFDEDASYEHILFIAIMINEKFRENVPAWELFEESDEDKVKLFFRSFFDMLQRQEMSFRERGYSVVFLIRCFQSIETECVRKNCLRLVSLPIWSTLSQGRLEVEFHKKPKLRRLWKALQRKFSAAGDDKDLELDKTFVPWLLQDFFDRLQTLPEGDDDAVMYAERMVELIIDLLSQLPTRRFFLAVVEGLHVLVRCRLSALHQREEGSLFKQLLETVRFYMNFEIDEHTGTATTIKDLVHQHASKLIALQRIAWKFFPELQEMAMVSIGALDNRVGLLEFMEKLDNDRLRELCLKLRLVAPAEDTEEPESREMLLEILVDAFARPVSQLDQIQNMSLYPNEDTIWDYNAVPEIQYHGETSLALPKLTLQFLTIYDYMLRSFSLYRLESTYEIRKDMEHVLDRMQPRQDVGGVPVFTGASRMALPIERFRINMVARPQVGEVVPAKVLATVSYDTGVMAGRARGEWENIREHDVVFLLVIKPKFRVGMPAPKNMPFLDQVGLQFIRGGEVVEVRDDEDHVFKGLGESSQETLKGTRRHMKLILDNAQYYNDVRNKLDEEIYGSFNLLVRRKPKENNFKAVLETIKALMTTDAVVPSWLHDIFLGYGDPASAAFYNLPDRALDTLDFKDTFLDAGHLREVFQDAHLVEHGQDLSPPFRLTFPKVKESSTQEECLSEVHVHPYPEPARGPYPQDAMRHNPVRYTASQVRAILSGMQPGLTMVVGPPGTGKTDVAVQIISNLYQNFPNQRTLLVTHSNQALNDLFEKLALRDIPERYMIRLGHGERHLNLDSDFSKFGRVNHLLAHREMKLQEVERLASSLELSTDLAFSCETAAIFYSQHISVLMKKFRRAVEKADGNVEVIAEEFPFKQFFSDAPCVLFAGQDFDQDLRAAEGCFCHIDQIFKELEECQVFELLRSYQDRANYLVSRHCRLIAMTCTHAALKRKSLFEIGFDFDNLVMEEAGQVLEVETFIPMCLQKPVQGENRLKRVVLIGDHHQLPPVVKNPAFQKFSNLEQSMFTRLVRLGVPHVRLDCQGRMRPGLADLFRWRYEGLKDLPFVDQLDEYRLAVPGMRYDFQFINVPASGKEGESTPSPFFYQNAQEAEFVAALFIVPSHKISVLTPYNGQKYLLREVFRHRCSWTPFFGQPARITTVDKFQGQQNDIILMSLVRTKAVGHIRDIRRLVVAMSRARLGLYLFGNLPLFSNCLELQKPLHFFEKRPPTLRLVPQERAPTRRAVDAEVPAQLELEVTSLADFGRLLQQMIQRRAQGVDQRQFESHMEEDVEPVEERKVTDMDTD